MVDSQSSFEVVYWPQVERLAKARFAYHPDRDERVLDSISRAWEMWLRKPEAPAKQIAIYAIRQVAIGRQFPRSIRSFDGPRNADGDKPDREEFSILATARKGGDPAELAAMRIDFPRWYASLNDRQQTALDGFLMGAKNGEIAQQLGCSSARISQIRRGLIDSWELFTA